MLDRSSDSQNNLRVKSVTKDLCSQNNQLYLCDGILSRRYEVIEIKRLLPSFHGQKPPSYRTSDS